MKKKLLTLATTAVLASTMVMSAFAATSDVTIDAAFSANTGEETVTGDFDVTYTLTDKSNGTDNWDNFILEIRTVENLDATGENPVYLDLRADNFGWFFGQQDTAAAPVWEAVDETTWETYAADMAAGVDCTLNVKRSGATITATFVEGERTFSATATAEEFDGTDCYIYLTGEQCELTNVVFTDNNAGSADSSNDADNDAADNDAADEDDTTAPTTAATTTAAPEDENGGVNVVVIVVVAVVAIVVVAGVVVATKKKN